MLYNVGKEEYHKEIKELKDRHTKEMREKESVNAGLDRQKQGLQRELKEVNDRLKQGC